MFKFNGSENPIIQIQLLLLLPLYEVCRSTVCMHACVFRRSVDLKLVKYGHICWLKLDPHWKNWEF